MSAKAYPQPLTIINSPLTVRKGTEEYNQQLQHLSSLAWQIAYTALWNGEQFSAVEQERAQDLINNFIRQHTNPRKAYAEFAQRVLLARQYILTHPGTYAPIPSQWLSPDNKNGFSGTHRWYASLENMRLSLPLYKMGLRAFPEAVYETLISGSARDFHFWRSYFSGHGYQALMNLYLSVVANASAGV